jgi:peptidyl-prolyl cis-trans isomerase SurA
MDLRKILLPCLGIISFVAVHAQTGEKKDDRTLFTVGNDPVSVDEFRYIYEKNNANDKNLYTEKDLREYLNLYANFKLKVREAHDMGLDTSAKFVKEFHNYREQLAQPYLTDRQVTQGLIDEAYERSKTELRASHILISCAPDAAPKDTLAAYNKAMEVYNKLIKGGDFQKLAREYSNDPSVANNGGDLGYFSAFQMIYPFENAAYKLGDTGKISTPVRTQFGYHIIKITDKRPYRGEILVRHILISSSNNDSPEKQKLAKNKIDSLYSQLQKGASFAELARQFSDHVQSRQNGGELPRFNSFAQYPEKFKDEAFALKKDGDYTKPFKTQFGWHLVQRVELKPMGTEKEMEETLKQKISRDSRSERSKAAAIASFRNQYHVTEDPKALKKFDKRVDTSLLRGAWKGNPKIDRNKVLFTMDGKQYTSGDYEDYLIKNQQPGRYKDLSYALNDYYKTYTDQLVFNYEDKNLETLYPQFKNVAKEYKEGILLFDITDQKVWGKAMTDTVGLKKFYEDNKDKYKWKDRADANVFDLRDKAAAEQVKKELKTGKKKPEDIADEYVKKDPLSLNMKEGLFEKGDNKAVDTVKWAPGVYDAGVMNNRYFVVRINKIVKPEYKKLSEVKGLVIADYQDYLEKQWLASLKQKYPVSINEQVVQSLVKK